MRSSVLVRKAHCYMNHELGTDFFGLAPSFACTVSYLLEPLKAMW